MYRLGFQPTLESMLALLRCFAEHDKRAMLLGLLKRMEAAFARRHQRESSNSSAEATDEPVAKDLVLPAPDVTAYLIVIEHLIAKRRTVAASHIALRMLKNLGHQSMSDTAVELVLRKLVFLLSDPRRRNEDDSAARLVEAIRVAKEEGTANPSPIA